MGLFLVLLGGEMLNTTEPRTLDERAAFIQALDFGLMKRKLMDPEEGQGWTAEEADTAEEANKGFLIVSLKNPEAKVVPCAATDHFWHQHILDTRRYPKDCEAIFGQFFHHDPYFGMQGDLAELEVAASISVALLRKEFGDNVPLGTLAGCGGTTSRCRNCGGSH